MLSLRNEDIVGKERAVEIWPNRAESCRLLRLLSVVVYILNTFVLFIIEHDFISYFYRVSLTLLSYFPPLIQSVEVASTYKSYLETILQLQFIVSI